MRESITPPVVRWIGVGTLALAFVLLAGCATGTGKALTLTAADRLERSAVTLAAATCSGPGIQCDDNRDVATARAFADDARGFRETVDNASGDRAVLSSFGRLWHSYKKLHYEVSRGGYVLDPYYN